MRSRQGVSMVLLVLVVLMIGGVLAIAFSQTSSGLARDEHRAAMGEVAQVLAENTVAEAYYALFNRINAPRESARYPVDVYQSLRDVKEGQTINFTFEPLLAWRTAQMPGVKLEPVQVSLRILKFVTETTTSYTRVSKSVNGALTPVGTQRRACMNTSFVPVVTQRRVAVGEAVFTARVTLDAGNGNTIERKLEVGHELRVGRVSEKPPLAWIDLVPIRAWQLVDRGGAK